MSEGAVPVPIRWRPSSTRSFVEVPVRGLRFGTIELQRLECHGERGHLVILHRPDGEVEAYPERHLGLDESWFRAEPPFAQLDLAHFAPTDFDPVRCDVGSRLVDAAVTFTDATGDEVNLDVRSPVRRWPPPLFAPAPRHRNPKTLRFLQQHRFRLLPRASSTVTVRAGGVDGEPTPFLVPRSTRAPYLEARAATDLLMVGLAPAGDDQPVAVVEPGRHTLAGGDVAVVEPGGLTSLRTGDGGRWFDVRFDPALPAESAYRRTDSTPGGRFVVTSPLGRVGGGRWHLDATEHGARLELSDVDQAWFPGIRSPGRLALWAARRARRRNERWRYCADLTRSAAGGWSATGSWSN